MTLKFYNKIKMIEVWLGDDVKPIQADCVVRNELNGWRPNPKKDPAREVVYAMTQDPYNKYPVMPRTFPKGRWRIGQPRKRTDPYLAPFYIPTDAEQWLTVWELDKHGGYYRPTDEKVLDLAYGIHFSSSNTTVGCIKIYREEDLLWLKNVVTEQLEQGRAVWIEV